MENLLFEVIVTPIIMEIKKVFKLYFKLNLKCRCHLRYFNVAIGVIILRNVFNVKFNLCNI